MEQLKSTEEPVLETEFFKEQEAEKQEDEEKQLSPEEIEEVANAILFEYLKSLEESEYKGLDLTKLKDLIEKIYKLKDKVKDNVDVSNSLDESLEMMKVKLSKIIEKSTISDENLSELLSTLYKDKVPVTVDLTGIDIEGILKLFNELQKNIDSKNLKQETAARGRLIKKLKQEQKNINDSFKVIETLVQMGFELSKENASIEKIKEILEKDGNKILRLYFRNKLSDLESLKNDYQNVINDEEIQMLLFLANALKVQTKEHHENLNKRYSKEFLDKKSGLTSIFTELPNAVVLAIKKLNTSIEELNQAETQRRKLYSIKNVMKEAVTLIGTPVMFTGKYLVSNWYTFFMAYQGIKESRAEAQEREREKQEQARIEAERREAEARALEEQQRLEAEKAEEAQRQEQAASQNQEQEAAQNQEQLQQQEQEDLQTQGDNVIPQPTPDSYQHLRGTRICTMIASTAFGGNIYEQLESGLITPDSQVRVRYTSPGAQWWEFWKTEVGYFNLWQIQEIWNWQCDLEKYASNSKSK